MTAKGVHIKTSRVTAKCILRQVNYGKAVHIQTNVRLQKQYTILKSSPRKEQHSNTKTKYKNTTQDKNKVTNAVVWLKTNTAIPQSTILIQKFYKLLIDQIAADQKKIIPPICF